jgi:hypothetical protein
MEKKGFLKTERCDVDEALLEWFKRETNDDDPVRDPLLAITLFIPEFLVYIYVFLGKNLYGNLQLWKSNFYSFQILIVIYIWNIS